MTHCFYSHKYLLYNLQGVRGKYGFECSTNSQNTRGIFFQLLPKTKKIFFGTAVRRTCSNFLNLFNLFNLNSCNSSFFFDQVLSKDPCTSKKCHPACACSMLKGGICICSIAFFRNNRVYV